VRLKTMKEHFNDSIWWHEKIHFIGNYIIQESFTRDNKGHVIDIDFVVFNKDGRFITLETNTTIVEIINKYNEL